MSYVDSSKTITHLSVCAGYGGIDLGLRRVVPNLRTVAFCEIEAFACANLVSKIEAGFLDAAPVWTDLKTFPWGRFHGKVDILSGGYPCQPFSAAGKRLGKEDPRHLWPWLADGISVMRPGACFFENVDGHISLGLSTVISDLEELGYETAWGVFSAAEVGAPHQRKRVFILAYARGSRADALAAQLRSRYNPAGQSGDVAHEFVAGLEGLARHVADRDQPGRVDAEAHGPACEGGVWPARPGEAQHDWEPPRVVGNTERAERGPDTGAGDQHDGHDAGRGKAAGRAGESGEGVEHAAGPRCDGPVGHAEREARHEARLPMLGAGREGVGDPAGRGLGIEWDASRSECGGHADGTDAGMADAEGERPGEAGRLHAGSQVGSAGCSEDSNAREIKSSLGLHPYGAPGELGSTELSYEHKTHSAREVLLALWGRVESQDIQWSNGGPCYILAEAVLQSGVQLSEFPQRICFFVWCIQAGHPAEGFGLPALWLKDAPRNTPQGQEPAQQLRGELAYALCVLSHRAALERGQGAMEEKSPMQSVWNPGTAARVLPEALVPVQKVWESEFNQEVWKERAYLEAADSGCSRTDELRLLGNGVVPATAAKAFLTLMTTHS